MKIAKEIAEKLGKVASAGAEIRGSDEVLRKAYEAASAIEMAGLLPLISNAKCGTPSP